MRVDNPGDFVKKYDVSSLQLVTLAGERCDPEAIKWLRRNLPRAIINDNWW
jgi:propionyl-CoA synthetase